MTTAQPIDPHPPGGFDIGGQIAPHTRQLVSDSLYGAGVRPTGPRGSWARKVDRAEAHALRHVLDTSRVSDRKHQ